MNNFDPIVLFSTLREMLADMWWPALVVIAIVLFLWISAIVRCWTRGLRVGRAVGPSIGIGIVVGIVVSGLLPAWTGASFSAFGGAVDVAVVVLTGIGVAAGVSLLLLPVLSLSNGRR